MTDKAKVVQGEKLRGAEKVARIPIKVIPTEELPRKPDWIRVRIPASPKINEIKQKLQAVRPETVAQASRIQGVTPAAVSQILVHLKKRDLLKKQSA